MKRFIPTTTRPLAPILGISVPHRTFHAVGDGRGEVIERRHLDRVIPITLPLVRFLYGDAEPTVEVTL